MVLGYLHPNQWPYLSCLEVYPPRRHDDAGARCIIDNIRVGRTADGLGATLSITERYYRQHARSVHHETVWDHVTYGFTGATWQSKNDEVPVETGQIIARIQEAATYEPITPVLGQHVLALCDLWQRWHRSDLRPGCAHQETGPLASSATTLPCPHTGYKFGTEWLVEAVPEEVGHAIFRHVHSINAEWVAYDRARNAP